MAGFGGAVKLTGESEYRKALKQIGVELKEVDSRLKLVASQYDKADKSQEAITAQSAALSQKLDAEAKKVVALEKNFYSMTQQAEANKKAHTELKTELDNAVKELEKIEQESGKNSAAYKTQKDAVAYLSTEYAKSSKAIENQEAALSKARAEINNAKTAYNNTGKALSSLENDANEAAEASKELGKETEEAGNKAEKAGNGGFTVFKGVVANLASTAITAALDGLKKLGGALVDVGKESINSYAEFEQLAGGAQKIFDEMDYSQIATDAANAYKELNLSANEYLEAINQTGATFAQTMGDQKGYDTAREGLQAIADYASGTGKSVSELSDKYSMITRATSSYQSIADQFAGLLPQTTSDFLKQAQAAGYLSDEYTSLTDVPVAEYQEAVTKMLTDGVTALGLAGNTANETSTTISGSLAALSATWKNLVTGLADDGADLNSLINNFSDSVINTAQLLIPRIQTFIQSAGTVVSSLLQTLLPEIINLIPPLLEQGVPVLITAIETTAAALMAVIPQILPVIFGAISTLIADLATWLATDDNLNQMLTGILELMTQLTNQFALLLPVLLPAVFNIIGQVTDFLTEESNIMLFVDSVLTIVGAIVVALVNSLPEIGGVVVKLGANLWEIMQDIGSNLKGAFLAIVDYIKDKLNNWINSVKSTLTTAKNNFFNKVTEVKSKIANFATDVINKVKEIPSKVVNIGKDLVTGLWNGINDKIEWVKQKISGMGTAITNAIKNVFGIHSPSSVMRDTIGKNLALGIGEGFETEMKDVTKDMQDALPTTFDVNTKVNANTTATSNEYTNMVAAFKEALQTVSIELDDQKVGKFVKNTVSAAIYT